MGKRTNIGQGAPSGAGGVANALAGRHAYSETGVDRNGNTVEGYGSTPDDAHQDYLEKGGVEDS